jgi:RNA polymerase sigma-70 factor (ECF subfamily)
MTPTPEIEKRKLLVSLLATHQRRILAYIHSLVPNPHDADDLLQETCEIICEKFDDFRPGTDFLAWAFRIAHWRVRAARTSFARSKVLFNDDVLEAVAKTAASLHRETDPRQDALEVCIKKLPERDRVLILSRYQEGATIEQAAERSGRSLEAAYKALSRTRKLLLDCVNNRLGLAPAGAVRGGMPA